MPSGGHRVCRRRVYAGLLVLYARKILRLLIEVVRKSPPTRMALRCSRTGGWSSGPWPGSCGAAGLTATTSSCLLRPMVGLIVRRIQLGPGRRP